MPIDFSKFGKMADSVKQKIDAALENDNKVSENEIKQMNLSKELEKTLREELSRNPGMYEDAFVVTQQDERGRYTIKLDKGKSEGPLRLEKDTLKYFKKNYPEAEVAGAYLKNGVVYMKNKNGEPAIDKNGAPITYRFAKEQQGSSIDLLSYYLEHNNGVFDLNKFNTIRAVQARLNSVPEVTETYTELMKSIEFEEADEEGKTRMLFEQAKANVASSSSIGEVMQNMFTCLMLNCQVMDYNLNIPKLREHFNEFFGLDKLAELAQKAVNDGDESQLSVLENIVSETIGVAKGMENFMTSTQLLAFIGMISAAATCSEAVGLGEVFAIATTGFFGYEAGTMGIEGFLDGLKAKTPEEAEKAGEMLGTAALMMLGVVKGGNKVLNSFIENHSVLDLSADFNSVKELLMKADSRESLVKAASVIKQLPFDVQQKLELNKIFFRKTLEIQSNYTEIQKSIVNMHQGEISPKVLERNQAIKEILDNVKEGETITLKQIATKLGISVADVQNSIYNKKYGLKPLFDKVNSRNKTSGSTENAKSSAEAQQAASSVSQNNGGLNADYIQSLRKQIKELNLSPESEREFNNGFWEFPAFADKLLSFKDSNGLSRLAESKNADAVSKMFEVCKRNPELSDMFFEKDVKGHFKYTLEQVEQIMEAAESRPELMEYAKEKPDFVSSILDVKNSDGTPFYSTEDVGLLLDESKRMPGFVRTLTHQTNNEGNPRFTAEQIKDIIHLYYTEPYIAKLLVYTQGKDGGFKYSAECVSTVAKTFESGTGVKKALARKMLNETPSAYPDGKVPENPSEVIVAELSKVVKRGRPPKQVDNTQSQEAQNTGVAEKPAEQSANPSDNSTPAAPATPTVQTAKYEFKQPAYNTSPVKLEIEAAGTEEKLFEIGERKLFNYIKNLHSGSSITEPVIITVGNNRFGFTIKKSLDNKTTVTVKNWLGDKASWDKAAYVEKVLTFELDENGQITSGIISWNDYYESAYKSDYSYTFSKDAKGNNIITYNEAAYGGKHRFKTSTRPLESVTRIYEQSPENPAVWYRKTELDQVRSSLPYDFNLSEGSLEMIEEAFVYSPENSSLMNLLLNIARGEKTNTVTTEAKPVIKDTGTKSTAQQAKTKTAESAPAPEKIKPAEKEKAEPVVNTDETAEVEEGITLSELLEMTKNDKIEYSEAQLNELLIKIPKKIKSYLDRMASDDKMNHPVSIGTINLQIAKNNGVATVEISSSDGTLKLVVDRSGQMTNARLFHGRDTYTYTRSNHGVRRLVFNGTEYQPVGKTKDTWSPVRGRLDQSDASLYLQAENEVLPRLMMKLGEVKAKVE